MPQQVHPSSREPNDSQVVSNVQQQQIDNNNDNAQTQNASHFVNNAEKDDKTATLSMLNELNTVREQKKQTTIVDSDNLNGAENGNTKDNSNGTINGAKTTTTTTKLNGLKNRIIQRPPPLILDKVSNFYDSEAQSLTSQPQQPLKFNKNFSSTDITSASLNIANTNLNQNQQYTHNHSNSNSANQKFWASLNQTAASRTRSLVIGRNGLNIADETNTTNHNKNDFREAISATNLEPDLIISHRNNGTKVAGIRGKDTNPTALLSNSNSENNQQNTGLSSLNEQTINEIPSSNQNKSDNPTTLKSQDMSNNSEFDDSSTHGGEASENDGGNLVGIHNPTPPALNLSDNVNRVLEEPPISATGSRPRSNNPFLDMDDELLTSFAESHNNFRKRPASFMAATGTSILPQQSTMSVENNIANAHQIVQEQFNNLQLNNQNQSQNMQHEYQHQTKENLYSSNRESIYVDHQRAQVQNPRETTPLFNSQTSLSHQSHQPPQSSIYGIYGGNYVNYEPTISLASESAVSKPPQNTSLPSWTEAIYQLNNAILETNSVAGGAENGQFIYIVENGDIILELDNIKVSGFTLVEFNELLESKPMHLLSAVQTKHSQGLTIDLKQFLNCSFPKNSSDKELQDLIRENIYRRTVPCTTRPPRAGEVDKVDYHFLSKERFRELDNKGMLLESGMYGGHYYGTIKCFKDINSLLANKNDIQSEPNENNIYDAKFQNQNQPTVGVPRLVASKSSTESPLYENHETLRMQQVQVNPNLNTIPPTVDERDHYNSTALNLRPLPYLNNSVTDMKQPNIVAIDSEALPLGWERVIDQTHGTYYIDHNTQRTQYERPYEIELTKGAMGFGFTLVEAENGVLLVRSIIPGGPAQINGTIRPGDILISAVGVSVAGLQHTDIARLFSTFAVGDRVRLTFARSAYVVDANLIPDEYLFSNGTNGDLRVAVNSNYYNYFNQNMVSQSPQIVVNQEFEFINVTLKRGDQGFGFTISDSIAGQKVRKIQNNDTCTNLKQGDILISLNGIDITNLKHKEVVKRLKDFPPGCDVALVVKRKKRFRSKTPMAMHTENDEFPIDSTPQRNCKTPSLDGLMLRRSCLHGTVTEDAGLRPHFPTPPNYIQPVINNPLNASHMGSISQPTNNFNNAVDYDTSSNYYTLATNQLDTKPAFNVNPITSSGYNSDLYYSQLSQSTPIPSNSHLLTYDPKKFSYRPPSIVSDNLDNLTSSVDPSVTSLPPIKGSDISNINQINQYNNFMHNDKLIMMQMQQPGYHHVTQSPNTSIQTSTDYNHMPLYSNSDLVKPEPVLPVVPLPNSMPQFQSGINYNDFQNNYYANNEEIALQRVQYGAFNEYGLVPASSLSNDAYVTKPNVYAPITNNLADDQNEYEYHQVDLDKEKKELNWGIRLIGGSEVKRAISIGSIVHGGAASKNGKLEPGDEIISIDGKNVVGARHQDVVKLISACSKKASLVVRRKRCDETCEVVLTRNMSEGFGFVIISSGNCALIGRIIKDSPADRCRQLHVKDRIIAVNGHYITPNMQHPEIVNMIKKCGSELSLRIIPANCYTVELIKSPENDNFGFSMRGGSEYDGTPLYIVRVAENGLARDLLNRGDQILEINNISTVGMTHHQAATIIKHSDPTVKLKLRRNYGPPPSLLVDSPRDLQKFNQVTAEMKTVLTNSTPSSFIQEGSISSDSQIQQNSIPNPQAQSTSNNMVYIQSHPLYAT